MVAIHPIPCIFLMLWSCHSSFKWWGSSFLPLNLGRPVMRAEGILCEPGQGCDDSRNDTMWLRLSGQVMPLPLGMLILGTLCCEETKRPHGQTTCRCCGNSPAEVSAHRSSNCQHGVMRSQPPAFRPPQVILTGAETSPPHKAPLKLPMHEPNKCYCFKPLNFGVFFL